MDIDKILLNILNSKASKAEYEALEQWKAESEENINLLKELSAKHKDKASAYKEYDKEAAWEKMESNMVSESKEKFTPKESGKLMRIPALLLIIGAIYFLAQGKTEESPKIYESQDATLNFALADNSQIWLREGGSTLNIISDFDKERKVALEGEAFFDIAHDAERPFIIEVRKDDHIKVVGTSFTVLDTEDEFDLTVYSGVVEFHTLNRVLTLQKGDQATLVNDSIVKTKNRHKNKLSWKTNELVFNETQLGEVFSALQDHYDITISTDEANLNDCRLRTRFTTESIEEVFEELSSQFGFNYEINDKVIAVRGISCN